MTQPWAFTIDCTSPAVVAAFWREALGYVDAPPPEGWATWVDWLRHFDVPEDEWDDGASLVDPDGVLPKISLLKVPEAKTVKNRLHLDLMASGGRHHPADLRTARIREVVERLVASGGRVVAEHTHDGALDHVVMADPEDNEFCVV